MTNRLQLDINAARTPRPDEVQAAIDIVDRSGLVPVIDTLLKRTTGRPRVLTTCRGPLIGFMLNALGRHHRGHIIQAARVISAMSPDDRARADLDEWHPTRGMAWLYRFIEDLAEVLREGPEVELDGETVRLGSDLFLNRLLQSAIPPDSVGTTAIAIDGTAIDTWGALYGDADSVEDDREQDEAPARPAHLRSRRQPARRIKHRGDGPDGRKIYTCDATARAGHRTATNSRPSGPYIGYELHIATQVRSLIDTNYIDEVKLGPVPPGFVLGAALRPAGSHRGLSIEGLMESIRCTYPQVNEIVADPGYTSLMPEKFMLPARRAGFDVTFEPITHQRTSRPTASGALLLEGGYFSDHLPADLRGIDARGNPDPLPRADRGADLAKVAQCEEAFNRRALYRYSRHSRPDSTTGSFRIRCPFCCGRLRSRAFPETMRGAHHVPLVHVEGAPGACCSGSVTVPGKESALWQPIPAFTTAWRISYGRRQAVEGTNAALKDQWVQMGKGFCRVLDMYKLNILTAFALAGYNHNRAQRAAEN